MTATYPLFCMGNPLLDVSVTSGEEIVKKYVLKYNDAILAEEKHMPMYVGKHIHLVFRQLTESILATRTLCRTTKSHILLEVPHRIQLEQQQYVQSIESEA
jgi:hypothetical protein